MTTYKFSESFLSCGEKYSNQSDKECARDYITIGNVRKKKKKQQLIFVTKRRHAVLKGETYENVKTTGRYKIDRIY